MVLGGYILCFKLMGGSYSRVRRGWLLSGSVVLCVYVERPIYWERLLDFEGARFGFLPKMVLRSNLY